MWCRRHDLLHWYDSRDLDIARRHGKNDSGDTHFRFGSRDKSLMFEDRCWIGSAPNGF